MSSLQELSVSDRQRRQAQQERDEMADEMVNNSTGKWVSLQSGTYVPKCPKNE